MKKNKKVLLWILLSLLIIIILSILIYFTFFLQKEELLEDFNYKNISTLEYGNIILSDFVYDITCDQTCKYKGKKIVYTISEIQNLSEQEITIKITYNKKEYTHTFKVNVTDTTSPVLTLTKEEDTIEKDTEFDPLTYITSVNDNYDLLNNEDVKVENKVKTNKLGDYEVKYTVTDTSNNETSKTLIIHVIEKKEENQENNDKPVNNNTNTNNTNNNKPNTENKPQNNNNSNNNNQTVSNFKAEINKVKLNPIKTRYEKVDNKVESIINSVTNSSMDNYTKLQAIYDYVKNYLTYDIPVVDLGLERDLIKSNHYTDYDVRRLILADYGFDTKEGTCDVYAAMFMILARRIGFDAYVINGYAPSQSGGRSGHGWVTIKAGANYYFFDPQIEDYNKTKYNLFGKTVSESKMYSGYNINDTVNAFNYFREKSPLKLDINVTGALNYSKNYNVYYAESEHDYQTVYTDNTKFTINIKLTGTNLKYHIEYWDDNGKRVFKEVTGDSGTYELEFKKVGIHSVNIRTMGYDTSMDYYLRLEVKEKSAE